MEPPMPSKPKPPPWAAPIVFAARRARARRRELIATATPSDVVDGRMADEAVAVLASLRDRALPKWPRR